MPNEYSMPFRLSAKLGAEFNGTFGKAQKALEQTQKEIRELARIQSDVSAYRKQQESVESTAKKLQLLQQQYDNIQREIQETEGYSSSLENKLLDKQRAIEKTTQAYEKGKARLDEMGQSLREAGIDTDNLSEESKKLEKQQDELADQFDATSKEAEKYGKTGTSAFEAVGDALIAAGILKGLQQIAGAYKECVEISMEFGAELSTVESLSGASADEMEALRKKAQELGATTKYTATEAAQAMSYMGMAGWNAKQMIAGLDGVINLAAASGEDLAQVSDIVTDNLTAFGMEASETARFADVLAAAATNSNTSVSIMGETFKKAGPVAGALGYSIEDVSVAIGLMANAGVKGSRAGTALSNTFTGLLSGVTLTGDAIGTVEFNTVKADGTMMDFGETVNNLRAYFSQLSEAEKVSNAQTIAGKQGYAGLLAILNATDADYQKLTQNINDCSGAAEKMAKIRMDNLQGDVTLLKSAADGLKTTLGGAFEKEMRVLVKAGADILSEVNTFLQKNPVLMKALLGITGVLGTALAAYITYKYVKAGVNTLKQIGTLLTLKETAAETGEAAATEGAAVAQTHLNAAMNASPIMLAIAAFATLTIGIIEYGKSLEAANVEANELKDATEQYRQTVEGLNDAYNETTGKSEITAAAAQGYIDRLKELEEQGVETEDQQKEYAETLAKLHALMPDLNLEIDKQTGLLKDGASALEDQVAAWKENIKLQALENLATEKMQAVVELQYKTDQAQQAYDEVYAQWKALQAEHPEITIASLEERRMKLGVGGKIASWLDSDDPWSQAERLYSQLGPLQTALDDANDELTAAQDETQALAQAYAEAAAEVDLFSDGVSESSDTVVAAGITIEGIQDQLTILAERYDEAYQAAKQSIEQQFGLWDEAAEVVPKKVSEISNALQSQKTYWESYTENLTILGEKANEIDGLREMLNQFADGSKESVNAVAGMAKASDQELTEMVNNWKALKEQQDLAADALAEVRTGYRSELDNMQTDMEEAIDGLDLSTEAANAAKDTIDAYIDALKSGTIDAVAAASNIASLVAAALSMSNGSTPVIHHGGHPTFAYANGTDDAPPGWAWVGEQGPELMRMYGGEQILSHQRSEALVRERGNTQLTIAPTIYVEGGGSAESSIERAADALVERVITTLDEMGIDARREAYS